jgi:single-stranded-DNA-specific exonuclease
MPDPMLMADMKDALALILRAIEKKKRITVFGDYDADGITATALLVRFLSSIGAETDYYIPDRLAEGYGLNQGAIEKIHAGGTGLIVTVDCGISNSSEVALAKDLGLDVIITDHHLVPPNFNALCPVINPHRTSCLFPFKTLAGVGVAFLLTVAVRSALRRKGVFHMIPEPDLREYLDLVAIGTIADRVPLLGLNRTLARSGISALSGSRWPGIRAMIEATGLDSAGITGDDIAFRLAPRLNAPGRIGDPLMGMEILNTEDITRAKELAAEMNTVNSHRQALEQEILDDAKYMISEVPERNRCKTFVLVSEKWHRGVLGIVASKLVDEYNRPVILFTIDNGLAVGSGRSIRGFDLYGALVRLEHLLEKYGGHSRAAGLTISSDKIKVLGQELETLAGETLGDKDLVPTLDVDAEVSPREISCDMIKQINSLSPFGEGNPEPVLVSRSMEVLESRVVGEKHLKMRIGYEGRTFDSIGFGMAYRIPRNGEILHVAFVPEINRWRGYDSIQLRLVDFSVV